VVDPRVGEQNIILNWKSLVSYSPCLTAARNLRRAERQLTKFACVITGGGCCHRVVASDSQIGTEFTIWYWVYPLPPIFWNHGVSATLPSKSLRNKDL
jgi:hypothetical protein